MNLSDRGPDILEAFLGGEAEALAEVKAAVDLALSARSLNLGDAREDVGQETLRRLIVASRAGQFKGEASVTTYIYRVAHGAAIDHWRKVRRRREESERDHPELSHRAMPSGQISEVERGEQRDLVSRLLAELGSPCREILARAYLAEETYATIAEAVGKTEAAIKVQVHRCRRQASRVLQALQDSGSRVTPDARPAPNPSTAPVPSGRSGIPS